MGRLKNGVGSLVLCCGIAGLPLAQAAPAEAPTVQSLLAARDAELAKQVVDWNARSFELPQRMELDPSLRDAATRLVQDHLQRLRTLVPAWIAEERVAAKDPNRSAANLAQALYVRVINEMAIESVESTGSAHDETLLKAALAPNACRLLEPMPFARRIALIQAAPAELRPALLAAEKELLSRWGTQRQGLAARPEPAELAAADHAINRLREGLPVNAVPMTPFLAGMVFARDHKPGRPGLWEQCAKSQWWLQSQLADGATDRAQALTTYRYSMMSDASDYVPAASPAQREATEPGTGEPAYPHAASYFHVEGTTTLRVNVDEQGKATTAEVVARQLSVPGVRGNRPVAYETLLDDAAVAYARQRSYPVRKAAAAQFVMQWHLSKDAHEAQ